MENTDIIEKFPGLIKIAATFDTPEVELDVENGIFRIKGNSYPEDPVTFYRPVHQWFEKYAENPSDKTELQIHFKYFSTSSTQIFFDIFRVLEEIGKKGKEVSIKWLYDIDNEETKENGENYSTLFDVPFEFMAVEPQNETL
ncbi:MAG: DUF1987 domain-containing protein [Bacteroidales bacterium]|jgi:hypothetical protein|nr:DUF1987 domain-containing protein [Bacteroidales bacterium]